VRNGGERNRTLTIIKSRGMAHSNQASEYRLSDAGLELLDTYLGETEVLTGSARLAKEAEDATATAASSDEIARKEEERARLHKALERQMAALRERFESEDAALQRDIQEAARSRDRRLSQRTAMSQSRQAFTARDKARTSRR
jgi:circadian clock protein KaiC